MIFRDLAARNILITTNKILKISDFGMSRAGTYIYQTQRRLPLRWMAPEAFQTFIVDGKSDVWSYGIVLWEIGTLGKSVKLKKSVSHVTYIVIENYDRVVNNG